MSISIVNNKRLSLMTSMFLPTSPPPFIESKKRENFKLCEVNPYGSYLPPSPSETHGYENWNDNNKDKDYFSLPANCLATPNETRSKHSTRAFARLETTKEDNNRTLSQKAIVESPKTTVNENEENLILQLEDTTVPPMSSSSSISTSEESDIEDLNQENSTVTYKPPVLQKRLTRNFDSYLSEFIRHNESNIKSAKKPGPPSVFKNFF